MSRGRSGDEGDAPARIPAVQRTFRSEWTRVPFADLSGGPYCPRRTIRGWPHEGPERRREGIGGGGIAGP